MEDVFKKPSDEQMKEIADMHTLEEYHWLPEYGLVGLVKYIYTYGIVAGCEATGYVWRWCYGTKLEAHCALEDWVKGEVKEPRHYIRRLAAKPFQEEEGL